MTKQHKAAKTSAAVSLCLLVAAILPLVGAAPATGAIGATPPVLLDASLVQTVETYLWSPSSPDPSGVVYLGSNKLLISDSEVEEINLPGCTGNYANVNLWSYDITTGTATASGSTYAPVSPNYSPEPTGLGLHENGNLLVADDVQDDIDIVSAGAGGAFGDGNDTVVQTIQTQVFNTDVEGATWDSKENTYFAVAGELGGDLVYRLNGTTGAVMAFFPLPEEARDTPGIVYHAGRDTLLITDDSNHVYEMDKNGIHISTITLKSMPSGGNTIEGIALAPGSVGSDLNLWIANRRIDPGEPGPKQQCVNDGLLHEFSVDLPDDRSPSVNIKAPLNNTEYATGTNIAFQGVASDNDGDVTSSLVWTSDKDGQIGTGAGFNKVLSVGTHVITATATDSNNNDGTDQITVKVLPDPIGSSPGVVRSNLWYLNNGFDAFSDIGTFGYGMAADTKIAGDWNGDGRSTPGIIRGNVWYLNNTLGPFSNIAPFSYGQAGDVPVVGDWNGDGTYTPGIVRGNIWYLNNTFGPYSDVPPFAYGSPSDQKVVGDWNGDGISTPGVIRGNIWYLNNSFGPYSTIAPFAYGNPSDVKVAGDWNGNGTFTPGIVRSNVWFLNNTFGPYNDIPTFAYGNASDTKVVGDWDG